MDRETLQKMRDEELHDSSNDSSFMKDKDLTSALLKGQIAQEKVEMCNLKEEIKRTGTLQGVTNDNPETKVDLKKVVRQTANKEEKMGTDFEINRNRKGARRATYSSSESENDYKTQKRNTKRQKPCQKSSTAKPAKTREKIENRPAKNQRQNKIKKKLPHEIPKETQKDAPNKV